MTVDILFSRFYPDFLMADNAALKFSHIGYDRFLADVGAIATQVGQQDWRPDFIVGIGRGGLVPSTYLSHQAGIPLLSVDHSSKVYDFAEALLVRIADCTRAGERFLFVDDINDSGKTIAYIRDILRKNGSVSDNIRIAVLIHNIGSSETVDYTSRTIDRGVDKDWFVFPWEAVAPKETLCDDAQEVPERLGLSAVEQT